MPTPSKTSNVLSMEGKSHRTKAEMEQRKAAEASFMTGVKLKKRKEVSEDPNANKEFDRIRKLMQKIGKDDDLYGGAVNRLAQLYSECCRFEDSKASALGDLGKTEAALDNGEIDFTVYMDSVSKTRSNIIQLDKQIQTKRRMMLDIEKELLLTLASAMRAIPKKVEKDKPTSAMSSVLNKKKRG